MASLFEAGVLLASPEHTIRVRGGAAAAAEAAASTSQPPAAKKAKAAAKKGTSGDFACSSPNAGKAVTDALLEVERKLKEGMAMAALQFKG